MRAFNTPKYRDSDYLWDARSFLFSNFNVARIKIPNSALQIRSIESHYSRKSTLSRNQRGVFNSFIKISHFFISMVLEKYSKNVKKRANSRRRQFSYKKSRSVSFCSDADVPVVSKKKQGKAAFAPRRSKRIAFHLQRQMKQKKCPGAPHNTTSFLINFHKRDSSNDLLGRYGRNGGFNSDDLCNRYEVESVMQT